MQFVPDYLGRNGENLLELRLMIIREDFFEFNTKYFGLKLDVCLKYTTFRKLVLFQLPDY
jgi:hypothetical protein